MTTQRLLLVLALVVFVVAALPVTIASPVALVPLGLALWVSSALV